MPANAIVLVVAVMIAVFATPVTATLGPAQQRFGTIGEFLFRDRAIVVGVERSEERLGLSFRG